MVYKEYYYNIMLDSGIIVEVFVYMVDYGYV